MGRRREAPTAASSAAGGRPRLAPAATGRLPAARAAPVPPDAASGWAAVSTSSWASRGLTAFLAAALSLGLLVPAAPAITEENLVYLEAWRAVDRAYVDKKFNGQVQGPGEAGEASGAQLQLSRAGTGGGLPFYIVG